MKAPQFNVLNTIIEIEQGTKNSRMNRDNLSPIEESVRCFADYLQVEDTQAMFFGVIFSLNYQERSALFEHDLLEQLEEFEGILMATTNLTKNLDAAFDRRFFYKIRFREPSLQVKSRIWQSKIPALPEDSARMLAREYNFSGGQIDNVARKVITEEVLYGHKPDLGKIHSFCEDESIRDNRKRIGYGRVGKS